MKGFYHMMESGVEEIPPILLPEGGENSSKESCEKPEMPLLAAYDEHYATCVPSGSGLNQSVSR